MQLGKMLFPMLVLIAAAAGFFGGRLTKAPDEPGVAFATVDITCGKTTWRVETGNKKGECGIVRDKNGKDSAAVCMDKSGKNSAAADCDSNSGEGGCIGGLIRGSGSCTKVVAK